MADCTCSILGLPCECRTGPGRPQTRPHGTRAAYQRHYRHSEKPCTACRQWWKQWWQDTGRHQRRRRRHLLAAAQDGGQQ
jgi:hypothetical protein